MDGGLRIGELARRVGVSTDVLRAWERRFDLFDPRRSTGGYRLYTPADERLARDVVALRAQGLPMREAVVRARSRLAVPAEGTADGLVDELEAVVRRFDHVGAAAAVARATESLGVEAAIVEVVLPFLRRVGERWAAGDLTVAHEHLASHVIRRHLGSLAPDLPSSGRRVAVVGCPETERHDIGALALAVVLARRGWSVRFLGGDTPLADVTTVVVGVDAHVVVLAATLPEVFLAGTADIAGLARRTTVALGGRGATTEIARATGALLLPPDPVQAAATIDEAVPG